MQLVIVAFASSTVFLRTRWHTENLEDGRNFLSYLFYSAYFMNATGWSELSITVKGLAVHLLHEALTRALVHALLPGNLAGGTPLSSMLWACPI
jgi:hypothetical protein